MKYKIIPIQRISRRSLIIICVVVICAVAGFAGYKVSTKTDNASTQSTTKESGKTDQAKPEPGQDKVALPTPTTPVAPPPREAPKQSPVPVVKPTPVFTASITIKGDAACQSTTTEALKLLSAKAPTHYSTITSNISVIECAAQGSGMFAYENPPRYLVGDATRNAGTVWYAGTIAHDAGHSKLYHDYLAAHPGQPVPSGIWTGEAAERACLEAQYDVLVQIGGTQAQLDYIKSVIDTQYYNIPYDQRWW